MKELIYYHKNKLLPSGGPAGYLYNLNIELEKRNISNIEFLPDERITLKNIIRKKMANYPKIFKIIHFFTQKKYGNDMLNLIFKNKSYTADINLEQYDIIHFHCTLDMYLCKDSLENFKGKVMLTSHSPKAFHQELLDDFASSTKRKRKKEINKIDVIDEYAFLRADVIIFPVKESIECYSNTWKKFPKILTKIKRKICYLPTGTLPKKYNKNNIEFRKEYAIPNDSFLIAYVGRHNEIKGYDIVKEVAKDLFKESKNVYFIIGGQQGPLYQLNDDKWIEVGWTNDPGSIINAADMFILPNKETYFDLVMLEVLSIGTPVIASYTGGNKYFEKFNTKGIQLYKNYGELISMIHNLICLNSEDRDKLREKNRDIYYSNFTNEKFANRYLEIVNGLYD